MAAKFMKALGLGAALAAGVAFAPTAFAKDWKTVVIGMEGAYEPWNLTDPSGKIVGFEPDLIMDVCKRGGARVQDHRPGLGRHDPGPESRQVRRHHGRHVDHRRAQEGDRLLQALCGCRREPFSRRRISPLAKAPDAGKLVNLDKDAAAGDAAIKGVQAALKGKTLGVQVSTTHANFASQYFKDVATIKEYKTTDDRDLDLKSGRIDASLDDYPAMVATARKARRQGPRGRRAEIHRRRCSALATGLGIRKSDADLTAKFDKALTEAIADGSVKKLSEQWFKVDMTPQPGS